MADKSGWEKSEFPILCETCLGTNPYVRMMRAQFDKECKICARPFTVFRWRPGSEARYKKTEICQTCAKVKNVCQTCLLDLQFGLPVEVRDSVAGVGSQIAFPQSDVGREYFAAQAEKQVSDGGQTVALQYNAASTQALLSRVARSAPYYKRNAPHVCSFFLKGQCNRGASCPYRHEKDEHDPELANQNFKDRYFGNNDPVAHKIMGRLSGHKLNPPEDTSIKTVVIHGLDEGTTEQDLRDQFYAYGEIEEIYISQKSWTGFVAFATRQAAETAVEKLGGTVNIKSVPKKIGWGKPQILDQPDSLPPPSGTVAPAYASGSLSSASARAAVSSAAPPAPTPSNRTVYPSMNPQQFGSKRDR